MRASGLAVLWAAAVAGRLDDHRSTPPTDLAAAGLVVTDNPIPEAASVQHVESRKEEWDLHKAGVARLDNDWEAKGEEGRFENRTADETIAAKHDGNPNADPPTQTNEIYQTYVREDELEHMDKDRLKDAMRSRFGDRFNTPISADAFDAETVERRLLAGLPVSVEAMTPAQMKRELRTSGNGDKIFHVTECDNLLHDVIIQKILEIAPPGYKATNMEAVNQMSQAELCEEVRRLMAGEPDPRAPPPPPAAAAAAEPFVWDGKPAAHVGWARESDKKFVRSLAKQARAEMNKTKARVEEKQAATVPATDCDRFSWEEVWDEYTSTNSVRNPYMKEFLSSDKVLQAYYRTEWRYDGANTFVRKDRTTWPKWMREAYDARAKEEYVKPLPATLAKPKEGFLYTKSSTKAPAPKEKNLKLKATSPSSFGKGGRKPTGHGRGVMLAVGTRPAAPGVFEAGADAKFKVRTMLRVIDQIFSLLASLVSPPWIYVWLAAYLLNESSRV